MPTKDGRRLFRATLIRRDKMGEVISRKEAHTQAVSKEQAERFIQFRNPGYKITTIREE